MVILRSLRLTPFVRSAAGHRSAPLLRATHAARTHLPTYLYLTCRFVRFARAHRFTFVFTVFAFRTFCGRLRLPAFTWFVYSTPHTRTHTYRSFYTRFYLTLPRFYRSHLYLFTFGWFRLLVSPFTFVRCRLPTFGPPPAPSPRSPGAPARCPVLPFHETFCRVHAAPVLPAVRCRLPYLYLPPAACRPAASSTYLPSHGSCAVPPGVRSCALRACATARALFVLRFALCRVTFTHRTARAAAGGFAARRAHAFTHARFTFAAARYAALLYTPRAGRAVFPAAHARAAHALCLHGTRFPGLPHARALPLPFAARFALLPAAALPRCRTRCRTFARTRAFTAFCRFALPAHPTCLYRFAARRAFGVFGSHYLPVGSLPFCHRLPHARLPRLYRAFTAAAAAATCALPTAPPHPVPTALHALLPGWFHVRCRAPRAARARRRRDALLRMVLPRGVCAPAPPHARMVGAHWRARARVFLYLPRVPTFARRALFALLPRFARARTRVLRARAAHARLRARIYALPHHPTPPFGFAFTLPQVRVLRARAFTAHAHGGARARARAGSHARAFAFPHVPGFPGFGSLTRLLVRVRSAHFTRTRAHARSPARRAHFYRFSHTFTFCLCPAGCRTRAHVHAHAHAHARAARTRTHTRARLRTLYPIYLPRFRSGSVHHGSRTRAFAAHVRSFTQFCLPCPRPPQPFGLLSLSSVVTRSPVGSRALLFPSSLFHGSVVEFVDSFQFGAFPTPVLPSYPRFPSSQVATCCPRHGWL